jgi:membrane protease YdiL (CAAX protease family)
MINRIDNNVIPIDKNNSANLKLHIVNFALKQFGGNMLKNQMSSFLVILIIISAVFLLNMTISTLMSSLILLTSRCIFATLFLVLTYIFKRKEKSDLENLSFTLFTVNLAFIIVSFFTTKTWNLDLNTASGIAFAKLSDSFFISVVILILHYIKKIRFSEIFLQKGKLIKGSIIGIASFSLMAYLAINNPNQPISLAFLKDNFVWISIFVFSNAFMEELLFRGIFLKTLNKFMNPILTIILTSVVFAISHLQVTYTPDMLVFLIILFILGAIWGFLIKYTKSLIASILFHAGADLLIILPIFANFGVEI